jgi:hypothetical protein
MHLHHQHLVDRLVRQHAEDFAYLHHDLTIAVPEVASRWADRFPNATELHGMTRCTDARQTLFSIFAGHGDECFPTLSAKSGPANSVVLTVAGGARIRVRRWPSDHLGHRVRVVNTPPVGQREAAAQARQLTLDLGLAEEVLAQAYPANGWGLYVLWWADQDEVMLDGASLTAVLNIDDSSQVQILAATPLPPAKRRPARAQPAPRSTGPDPQDDFGEFDHGSSSGAGGITPA